MGVWEEPAGCAEEKKQIIAHHFISIPAAINFTRRRRFPASLSLWICTLTFFFFLWVYNISCFSFCAFDSLTSSSLRFLCRSFFFDFRIGGREMFCVFCHRPFLIDYQLIDRFDTTGSFFCFWFLNTCLGISILWLEASFDSISSLFLSLQWLLLTICLFFFLFSSIHRSHTDGKTKNGWLEKKQTLWGEREKKILSWKTGRNLPFRSDRNALHPSIVILGKRIIYKISQPHTHTHTHTVQPRKNGLIILFFLCDDLINWASSKRRKEITLIVSQEKSNKIQKNKPHSGVHAGVSLEIPIIGQTSFRFSSKKW